MSGKEGQNYDQLDEGQVLGSCMAALVIIDISTCMFDNFEFIDLINVILYYNIYHSYSNSILVYIRYHNAVYISNSSTR